MRMQATSLSINKESIVGQARKKGGLLGCLFIREPLFDVTLEYRKFFFVTLDHAVMAKKFPFRTQAVSGSLDIIVDAMFDRCCVKEKNEPFALEDATGKEFQNGMHDMTESQALACAENYAKRIIFRMCRNVPTFTNSTISCFYRPFWTAYYGDPSSAKKPRYLPFAADGKAFIR